MCGVCVLLVTAVDERMKVQLKKYEEDVAAAASVGAGTGDVVAPRCVCMYVLLILVPMYIQCIQSANSLTIEHECMQAHQSKGTETKVVGCN